MDAWRRFAIGSGALAVAFLAPRFSSVARAASPSEARSLSAHAWLGVSMEKAPATTSGVHIKHVLRGSPAEKAGVKEGDFIRAIDGAEVGSPDDVTRIVGGHAPGDAIVASLSRAQETLSLKISLATRPSPSEMLRMDLLGAFAPPWVGVEPVGSAPASLSSLRGKVVLLDFWATWCGPCRLLAPKLSALQARYGAQGLRVVGITTDDAEKAALFAQRVTMRYPVEVDPKGDTSRIYDVSALPTLFILDKRGVVRDVSIGYDEGRDAQIETLLKELLSEPAPTAPSSAPNGE
jgi:thiol-disulfide isomerase/thioredoxin